MKKSFVLFSSFFLFFFLSFNIYAQFSKQDAIDLVKDSIAADRIDSVNIYMESQILTEDYYVISPYDSLDSPYSNYWLVFIDEQPLYLWDHLCTYVFINQSNGNYTTTDYNTPPKGYSIDFDSVSISINFPIRN